MNESYILANQKLLKTDVPLTLTEQLSGLQMYIKELSNGKADQICIFGAGEYGTRLYEDLRGKLISVHYFSDNDPLKWGHLFHHINCISPSQLKEEKERMLVIVATRSPTIIVSELTSKGFPYVTTKQEVDRVLINVSPAKWTTTMDNINNM